MSASGSLIAALLGGLLSVLSGCQPDHQAPSVEAAWLRAPPPGATRAAGYCKITNPGSGTRVIASVSSRHADRVELHTHSRDGDMMRMRKLDSLRLPANGVVDLTPGGIHLMLFGLDTPNGPAEVRFHFADGSHLVALFEVRSATEG